MTRKRQNDEQDSEESGFWPRGAKHTREFFPYPFNAADSGDSYRKILQYAFEDGRETMSGA